jgi:hypothetical protein
LESLESKYQLFKPQRCQNSGSKNETNCFLRGHREGKNSPHLNIFHLSEKGRKEPGERNLHGGTGPTQRGRAQGREGETKLGVEERDLDIDIITDGGRETGTPKHSVITAGFMDARGGWGQPVENNIIRVLLDMPKIEPTEGGGDASMGKRWQRASTHTRERQSGI